jgi:isocitrate dehydrogenase kinase/phosphatase
MDCYPFATGFRDKLGDIRKMITAMKSSIPLLRSPQLIKFDMLVALFYRNKGTYIIGRMMVAEHLFPVAIPILNDNGGLYADTIIWNENDISLIFSFTRSYFMADIEYPGEMVRFLQELLPNKKRSELYASLGFYKHGKTEFYRGFLDHLEKSEDQFVIAKGVRGLVMSVFTLPSYQVVFKVIKDRFSPTKHVTRQQVKDCYYLVKTHDRAGRMADTQEFSNFVFPRARFSSELIDELLSVAASSVELTDDEVILKHLYTERLMTPLNLYIEGRSDYTLVQALDEYGNAIKQLAAANIFPGDMLLKNFGVTRHGRVVFYDYDEICYLTDVNFRKIPPARYPEDELAAEPWYSVGPRDVFPEEFRIFLFNSDKLRAIFESLHGEIFDAEYWQALQKSILGKRVIDVFPYRRKKRFDQSASDVH